MMRLSISRRLAVMFASAGFLVFTLIGVVLHDLLHRELVRHERNELATRLEVYEPLVHKSAEPERWKNLQAKLDGVTPEDGRTRFWILSDHPLYHYGTPPSGLSATGRDGYGHLWIEADDMQFSTLMRTVPANGERPSVRFVAAIDERPYRETLQAFTLGLIVVSIVGILLVAMLGHWIARFGLRPLERLSREAQQLSPSTLSHRLTQTDLPPELSELAVSFNGALDRLESAYQQLEGFNADVAHELRTPLANLIGQTQVALSRERVAAELQDVLQSNLENWTGCAPSSTTCCSWRAPTKACARATASRFHWRVKSPRPSTTSMCCWMMPACRSG